MKEGYRIAWRKRNEENPQIHRGVVWSRDHDECDRFAKELNKQHPELDHWAEWDVMDKPTSYLFFGQHTGEPFFKIHDMKCAPEDFDGIWRGIGTFEATKQGVSVGDVLMLNECHPETMMCSGRYLKCRVKHIFEKTHDTSQDDGRYLVLTEEIERGSVEI